jgi:xanthine dehydrogenase accessory factor
MAMARGVSGQVIGSVSGGCIEDDSIRKNTQSGALSHRAPEFLRSWYISEAKRTDCSLPVAVRSSYFLEYNR